MTRQASESGRSGGRGPLGWLWSWTRRHTLAALLVGLVLLYVPFAGSYGLWDPWETHYGEVSRSILQRADPISPFWQDKWFWSKPILTFWLQAAGMRLLGVNRLGAPESEMALSTRPEWGMRLPIVAMSLLGLWALFLVIRRFWGRRAAVLAVVVCATSPMYAMVTRQAITDIPFVGPLTAAMAFLMLGLFGPDGEPDEIVWARPWLLVAGVAALMLLVWPTQDGRSLLYVEPVFGLGELALAALAIWLVQDPGRRTHRTWYVLLLGLQVAWGGVSAWLWGGSTATWSVAMLAALAFGAWELWTGHRVRVTAWQLLGVAVALATWPQFFLFGNRIGWRYAYHLPLGGEVRLNLYGWPYMLPWVALWGYYVLSCRLRGNRSARTLALHAAWLLSAVAVLAKGLGGLFLPMAVVGAYILVTREFGLLGRLELGRGLALWFAVAAPWHHAMWIRHRNGFWSEYFIHHHFKRLELGVHGERGTLEYFVHQLGFGMFPWVGLLPAALVRMLRGGRVRSSQAKAGIFLAVWAAGSFALFSLMETKFHHYVLPAVPPLAALVGIWLDGALDRRDPWTVLGALFGLGVALLLWRDLVRDPQHFVLMFIYKYDRLFPYELHFEPGLYILGGLVSAALAAVAWPRFRRLGVWGLGVSATAMALWCIDFYMVRVSPHWSQKQLHATYYRYRKGPRERLIAWQLNWRGENFYTKNHVVVHMEPKKTKEFQDYLRRYEGWTFYIVLERGRYETLKRTLPTERARRSLVIVGPDGRPWPDEWMRHPRAKRFRVLKKPYMNNKFLLVRTTI